MSNQSRYGSRENPKSPLNEAIGKLISRLRGQRRISIETLAQSFNGLSEGYVRQIESGNRALPAYSVFGLVLHLEMKWSAATGIVALASYLDVRGKDGYNFQEMLTRVQHMQKVTPQHAYNDVLYILQSLIDMCISGIRKNDYRSKISVLVEALIDLNAQDMYSSEPSSSGLPFGVESKTLASYGISPFFEDIVDSFASRLAIVPPHMNQKGISEWEHRNRERISLLLGYVSCADHLANSLPDFDWDFLGNSHCPHVRVIVGKATVDQTIDLESELRNTIIKRIRLTKSLKISEEEIIVERIRVISSTEYITSTINKFLVYDFRTQSFLQETFHNDEFFDSELRGEQQRSSQEDSQPVSNSIESSERYLKYFENVWIYKVKSESYFKKSEATSLIGYLSDYDYISKSGYAVGIDRPHMQEIINVLEYAFQADSFSQIEEYSNF